MFSTAKHFILRSPALYRYVVYIRAKRFEKRVAILDAYYSQEARKKGIAYSDTISRELIRRRLIERGVWKDWQIRDLHIFAVIRHRNWEREGIVEALTQCGELRHFDWYEKGYDEDAPGWWDRSRDEMNAAVIREYQAARENRPVDLLFTYNSNRTLKPETVREIAQDGVVCVNLSLDDYQVFRGRREHGELTGLAPLVREYDINVTSTKKTCIWYMVEGGIPYFLPEGANPMIYHPIECERSIRASFVGARYGYRPIIIDRLRKRGLDIEVYGKNWDSGSISIDDIVKIINKSNVNIGIGGMQYSMKITCLKARDFEVPMSGGLYLTSHNDELGECYDMGNEIICYRNEDDLLRQIEIIERYPKIADEIRHAGMQKARREHSWKARVDTLLEVAGLSSEHH